MKMKTISFILLARYTAPDFGGSVARDELHPLAAVNGRAGMATAPGPPLPLLILDGRLPLIPDRGSILASSWPASPSPLAGLVIDREGREARAGAARIELTFREFELLDFLASNPGKVFSRAQLLGRVWGKGQEHDTRTVDVHVHRLRRKLGSRHGQCLVTVRRVGYKYAPPGWLLSCPPPGGGIIPPPAGGSVPQRREGEAG